MQEENDYKLVRPPDLSVTEILWYNILCTIHILSLQRDIRLLEILVPKKLNKNGWIFCVLWELCHAFSEKEEWTDFVHYSIRSMSDLNIMMQKVIARLDIAFIFYERFLLLKNLSFCGEGTRRSSASWKRRIKRYREHKPAYINSKFPEGDFVHRELYSETFNSIKYILVYQMSHTCPR